MEYRVGGYERLSKEDERLDESSSIESQRMIIDSYIHQHHMKLVKHYSDDGFSGSHFQRPGFLKLKQDIEQGKINCVIVKDLSRLGRELYETGLYIEDYFLIKGIRFIAISDHYDSHVGDEMLALRLSVNDLYLRDTSKKIRMAFDVKRERGEYIASKAKYGYIKDPRNHHHLIIDKQVSCYVKMIFIWLSQGIGTTQIARRLTNLQVTIPSIYQKKRIPVSKEGGTWSSQTVREIGRNQMYLGHMVQGRWKKVSYHSKKLMTLPEDKWIIVKNTHEAIISQELYNQAQRILNQSKKYRNKNNRYLFQGLIYCFECKHHMSIHQKQKQLMVQCNYYTKYSRQQLCCSHSFNYQILENHILTFLKDVGKQFYEHYQEESLLKQIKKMFDQQNNQQLTLAHQLKKDIIKTQNILSQLYEDKLNQVISLKQYQLLSAKYQDTLLSLIKQQVQLQKSYHSFPIKRYQELIKQFMTFQIVDHELLFQIIDKIEVDKNRHIYIYFKVDMSPYITKVK
ncbi:MULTISPECIES: recombinase family protein [Coprobacillaceae]|uniref:recombinase family protein n=1 Tax=Coprobacillaceae TaxID=2810280 RepID=UPI000E49C2ED|nr:MULTISPECIES: recombinase family protein [Coprobacillaceae]RHM62880.1 hypothetical protein DWZ53_02330 [Coprobacillus sp. AF33-1AC]RHS94979.1 hypothetical protein DW911_03375 [Erysipelatoclostridium sp. AM42-17]